MIAPSKISLDHPSEHTLLVQLSGNWKIAKDAPTTTEVMKFLEPRPRIQQLIFETNELSGWDSSLLTFLLQIQDLSSKKGIKVDVGGLPKGVARLLDLATAVPKQKGFPLEPIKESFLSTVGQNTVRTKDDAVDMIGFIGEAFLTVIRLVRGKARFRSKDFWLIIQDCGAQALPIVTLISVLIGLILAFVGAVQLQMFGAEIYVADLVGIGMVREMGAIMTGIIMAGRTGSAFAAELGTMQVNEEIDALKTLGISPMEFLVLPRMLALVLMMPLLCLYSDFMGILGGAVVGGGMLDLSFTQYFHQTRSAVDLADFSVGLFKSGVFGVLVALSGCYRGIQCGRSSSAVGYATTSSVVTGIVSIIIADSLFTVVFHIIGV